MKIFSIIIFLFIYLIGSYPSRGIGTDVGLKAYQTGDYRSALESWYLWLKQEMQMLNFI